MQRATSEELAERVRALLQDPHAPPWFPTLTADLADAGWRALKARLRLTPASYGSTRVLRQDPQQPRRIVVSLLGSAPSAALCDGVPVELLPNELAREYVDETDIRFFNEAEIISNGISFQVEQALDVLGMVPTVLATVCSLIRALHLIDTGDDEIDVSFSEPRLPFTAFVSVPGLGAVARVLRVAEALLHEAMHLQLTLAEAVVPLVSRSDRTYFSPWRNEYRTAQGVLHALYVFRVIDTFLAEAHFEDPALKVHAEERRAMIAEQITNIQDFHRCPDLTIDGTAFVCRLLGQRAAK